MKRTLADDKTLRLGFLLAVVLILSAGSGTVVAQPDDPPAFEIATVNNESADQVNEVAFHRDAPIHLGLEGINTSAYRFNVTIGEFTYSLFPDDEGRITPRREAPDEGRYTLTVSAIYRGAAHTTATTDIEIVDSGEPRDPDPDPGEPSAFEIATVNNESADRVNEVAFHRDALIHLGFEGINSSAYRFNVSIGEFTYPLFPDDGGLVAPRGEWPDEGQYTLTVSAIYRGEAHTTATTDIEIVDSGEPRDPDPGEPPTFEIATVNNESADRVNEVAFHRDAPIHLGLEGINTSAYRFNVSIGEFTYPLFPDDEGRITPRREAPDEGRYTLTVRAVYRGEPATAASTEIEIVQTGTDRDGDSPDEASGNEADGGGPGFGILAAATAILSLVVVTRWRE